MPLPLGYGPVRSHHGVSQPGRAFPIHSQRERARLDPASARSCLRESQARRAAGGQTPSSLRSLSTCPVAFTPYWACSSLPSAPTTKVDLITPIVFFPYINFSP